MGRELNVDVVLWGSYTLDERDGGTRMIIRGRLIETETGNISETFKEEGKIGYDVQRKIAEDVMKFLYVDPTSQREVRRRRPRT